MVSRNSQLKVTVLGDAGDAVRALKQMDSELGRVKSTSARVSHAMGTAFRMGAVAVAAGATAATAAGVAVFKLANSYAEAGSQIHDLAQRTGFSTVALSELKYAADQSGTSIEGLEVGIRRMTGTVVDAGDGVAAAKDLLGALGVSVDELRGKSPEQVFDRMVAGLAGVDDELTRASLATDLFGRAGTQLLPLLDGGTAGLAELRKEADATGTVFSTEAAAAADKFGDQTLQMNREIQGLKYQIASELLPVLGPMVQGFTAWIDQNGDDFARETAKAIQQTADAANNLYSAINAIAKSGPVQVAIDLIADLKGTDLSIIAMGLVAAKFGGLPLGLFVGATGAGAAASAKNTENAARGGVLIDEDGNAFAMPGSLRDRMTAPRGYQGSESEGDTLLPASQRGPFALGVYAGSESEGDTLPPWSERSGFQPGGGGGGGPVRAVVDRAAEEALEEMRRLAQQELDWKIEAAEQFTDTLMDEMAAAVAAAEAITETIRAEQELADRRAEWAKEVGRQSIGLINRMGVGPDTSPEVFAKLAEDARLAVERSNPMPAGINVTGAAATVNVVLPNVTSGNQAVPSTADSLP